MSMNLALFYRNAIARPLDSVRRRVKDHRSACVAAQENAPETPRPQRHDAAHFERITAYACAGYFNMGYTLELFHVSD